MLQRLRKTSFKAGRVKGTQIRVHFTLVLWVGYFMVTAGHALAGWSLLMTTWVVSVLLHELGHVWGARRMGLRADEVILWPLGGLAPVEKSQSGRGELVSVGAGPAANLILFALGALGLLAVTGGDAGNAARLALGPLNGSMVPPLEQPLTAVLQSVVAVNGSLFALNVLPAFPLDGGSILRGGLWTLKISWRTATLVAAGLAMGCGLGLVIAAPFTSARAGMLGTMFLAILGVFVIVTSFGEFRRAKAFVVLPTMDDDLMPHERQRA